MDIRISSSPFTADPISGISLKTRSDFVPMDPAVQMNFLVSGLIAAALFNHMTDLGQSRLVWTSYLITRGYSNTTRPSLFTKPSRLVSRNISPTL